MSQSTCVCTKVSQQPGPSRALSPPKPVWKETHLSLLAHSPATPVPSKLQVCPKIQTQPVEATK